MDMIDYLWYLDDFVKKMKIKIIAKSGKYNDKCGIDDIKEHLVDEIFEMFNFSETEIEVMKPVFMSHQIDTDESIDVANMCWIFNFIRLMV